MRYARWSVQILVFSCINSSNWPSANDSDQQIVPVVNKICRMTENYIKNSHEEISRIVKFTMISWPSLHSFWYWVRSRENECLSEKIETSDVTVSHPPGDDCVQRHLAHGITGSADNSWQTMGWVLLLILLKFFPPKKAKTHLEHATDSWPSLCLSRSLFLNECNCCTTTHEQFFFEWAPNASGNSSTAKKHFKCHEIRRIGDSGGMLKDLFHLLHFFFFKKITGI